MNIPSQFVGSHLLRTLLTVTLTAAVALAADGVIEINQTRALTGNITAGDEPGFPISLNAPGSYLLTGSLSVDEPDMAAIEITVSNVNLDLNGFTVRGPARCANGFSGGQLNCGPKGDEGYGIAIATPPGSPVIVGGSVSNGTVRGMGSSGIFVEAVGISLSDISVVENAGDGIRHVGESLTVRDCTILGNQDVGLIIVGVAENNTVSRNGQIGIIAERSRILGNTVSNNGQTGIVALAGVGAFSGSLVRDNMISGSVNPQLDMSGGGAWGGNILLGPTEGFGTGLVLLPPSLGFGGNVVMVHEQSPNTCNGQPCSDEIGNEPPPPPPLF